MMGWQLVSQVVSLSGDKSELAGVGGRLVDASVTGWLGGGVHNVLSLEGGVGSQTGSRSRQFGGESQAAGW